MFKKFFSNQFIQAIFFIVFLVFLWEIRNVLIILFLAVIIASSLYPISTRLAQHMPKMLAIGIPYIIFVILVFFILFSFIPILTNQTRELITRFPQYLEDTTKSMNLHINVSDIRAFFLQRLTLLTSNVYSITTTVFGELLTFFFILFISIYLLADRNTVHHTIAQLLPGKNEKNLVLLSDIESTLGAWARGQIILSAAIFAANFLAYILIGIPFALPLALIAGVLEIVPTIGPVIAAIPALIVALTISPIKTLIVFVIYILIQVVEGNFLVPKIMEQAVGIHPIIVMIAILIGGELMGIAGALIAIPFVSLLTVIFQKAKTEPLH